MSNQEEKLGDNSEQGVDRRKFLKTAGIAAAGAAAATQVAPGEAEARETRAGLTKGLYQETEHVRRFYALNRWVSGI